MEEVKSYTAEDLFNWVTDKNEDFTILDVRREDEFDKFKVETPYIKPLNIPYIDFSIDEKGSSEQVPKEKKVRVVCSKEGSAKYVAEVLVKHGLKDVRYLQEGIKTWGNVLIPRLVNPGSHYELYQFIRPGKASCSYGLLYKGEMMVFDPSRNIEFYKKSAGEHNCRIKRIFETHLQADYISGSRKLSSDINAEIMANNLDFEGAGFMFTPVNDGDIWEFSNDGGPQVKAVHTPGHTPGSTSYLINEKYLLSGDTVFISSIGRPDLGGKVVEWAGMLFDTLKNKIQKMDESLLILPTHYVDWSEATEDYRFVKSLKEIKERNAHIYGIENKEDFIRLIKENMRDQPEVYAKIRTFNKGLSEVDPEEQEVMDIGKHECAMSKAQMA